MSASTFFYCLTCASQARWDALEQVIRRRQLVREVEATRRARYEHLVALIGGDAP